MLKQVLIIANPGSGKGLGPTYAEKLSDLLKEVYQSNIEIRETMKVGDAEEWAAFAKTEGFDTVICLGGDGTVSEVINGLMRVEEPPLFSFVPIGTANDLGRVLGFDMRPDAAIEQFNELVVDAIDVGQVNDHYFMDVVALGDIPTAVMETESEKKNKFGFFAYIADGIKAMVENEERIYQVIDSQGTVYECPSKAMLVALTSSIGGMENIVAHRRYNDGFFQFAALKGNLIESTIETLITEGGIPEGLTDNENLLSFSDSYVSIQLTEEDKSNKIYANVDGDKGPFLPLEIKVHQEALKVLKPRSED